MQYHWHDHISEAHQDAFFTLYTGEWWTKGRSYDDVIGMLAHCDVIVACSDLQKQLVGFARVLTDYTFKALIFDVIIAESQRGQGLGQQLVSRILQHQDLKNVKSFELYCPDRLSPFYEKLGFVKGTSCLMFHQS